jgi:GDP/UDP-N,N'-diacetylbacillosamine 2-epimerase (hydrolysing)
LLSHKICFISGARSEYGLLLPLIKLAKQEPDFSIDLIVTGSHLASEFGNTKNEIEQGLFNSIVEVPIINGTETEIEIINNTANALTGISTALQKLKPSLVIILGDRYEIFAAATAASFLKIPIAHLHGGELTLGAIDDTLRHCISKMSHLHFTATLAYKKRVEQLGEQENTVFNVGALGVDSIFNMEKLSQQEIEDFVGLSLTLPTLMVTFHPETLAHQTVEEQFEILLNALAKTNYQLIFTYANADAGGTQINKMIDAFVQLKPNAYKAFTSLGQKRYLSALQYVHAMVGNSSSGILEMPYYFKTTINIGERQTGRLQPDTIINCACTVTEIDNALQQIEWHNKKIKLQNPLMLYGNGNAAKQIVNYLKSSLPITTTKKVFNTL